MSVAKRLGAIALAVVCLMFTAVSFSQTASAYPSGTNPKIGLDHSSGPVGDKVVVSGRDFTPNKTATLSFHSATVGLGSVHISAGGTFSVTITIPNDPVGAHLVVARDNASGQDATADFTITGNGTGGTGGGLANTGVAVLGIAALGLVLLVGGGLMLMAGRRRKVVA